MTLGTLYKTRGSVRSADGATELLYGGTLLPKQVFRDLQLADEVLREAEVAASQLIERTRSEIDAERRAARSQGHAQGHREAIGQVLGALEIERRLRELLCERLAVVVETCLRGLIGEPSETGTLRDRVLHLLRTAGVSTTETASEAEVTAMVLYVNPQQVLEAKTAISDLSRGLVGDIGGLRVVCDARRALGSLMLETRYGFVESDLELTMSQLRSLIQDGLDRATRTLGDAA